MYLTSVVSCIVLLEVSTEWVEISQLTYRKPATTFSRLHRPTTPAVRGSVHKVRHSAVDRVTDDKQLEKAAKEDHVNDDSENLDKKDDNKASKIEEVITSTSRPTDNKTGSLTNNDKHNNVVKLLTLVAATISKHTTKNIHTKLDYLHQLQRSLLNDIELKIEATWPDDDGSSSSSSRNRRATSRARGHVDFPSSESALMTISFLTFAVFLIKLVLQVIQTYKNKTMMLSPAVLAFSKTLEVDPHL